MDQRIVEVYSHVADQVEHHIQIALKHAWLDARHTITASGIPRRALLLNLTVGAIIILSYGSWKSIVSSLSFYYGLSYAAVSIAVSVLYATSPAQGRLGSWSKPIAFTSFVLSGLILYWSSWNQVRVAIPLVLVGVLLYL